MPTRFAGLFYLPRLLLQLELGETLWCAGVMEGPFLCRLARLLLAPHAAHDPAPKFFGGANDDVLAAVQPWAAQEITDKLHTTFEAWLLKRGLAVAGDGPEQLAKRWGEHQQHADQTTDALLVGCAATVLVAFCAALDVPPERATLVERLRIPGRLREVEGKLEVHMSMDAIDIEIRRAGLDIDPGYVPWLKRDLRLVFGEPSSPREH